MSVSLGSELAVPFVNGQLTATCVFYQSGHLFAGSFFFPERVPARFLGARRLAFSFSFVASRGLDQRAPFHCSLESLVSFSLNPVPPVRSLAAHALL